MKIASLRFGDMAAIYVRPNQVESARHLIRSLQHSAYPEMRVTENRVHNSTEPRFFYTTGLDAKPRDERTFTDLVRTVSRGKSLLNTGDQPIQGTTEYDGLTHRVTTTPMTVQNIGEVGSKNVIYREHRLISR
jgi:hypothetical protein